MQTNSVVVQLRRIRIQGLLYWNVYGVTKLTKLKYELWLLTDKTTPKKSFEEANNVVVQLRRIRIQGLLYWNVYGVTNLTKLKYELWLLTDKTTPKKSFEEAIYGKKKYVNSS